LASGVLAQASLNDIAHDGFVDVFGVDSRTADGFGYGFGAKVDGGEAGEAALEFADGRAHRRENDRSFHANLRRTDGHQYNALRRGAPRRQVTPRDSLGELGPPLPFFYKNVI
jgi:hypothetical protein